MSEGFIGPHPGSVHPELFLSGCIQRAPQFLISKSLRGMAIADLGVMQTRLLMFGFCFAGGLTGLFRAVAEYETPGGIAIESTAQFYQPLAASGSWVQTASYGRCWHPPVTAEWRPYGHGRWQWSDCGWYWTSDEPWAWACYHYGTWVADASQGWLWVPGTQWAPAWVRWRTGPDYIGWAPQAPAAAGTPPAPFVFIRTRDFTGAIRPDTVLGSNEAIISRTTESGGAAREQRAIDGRMQTVYFNNGPSVELVEKATGHKVESVSVQKLDAAADRTAPPQLERTALNADAAWLAAPDPSDATRNLDEEGARPQAAGERRLHLKHDLSDQQLPNSGIYAQSAGEETLDLPQYAPSPGQLPNDGTYAPSPWERTLHAAPPNGDLPAAATGGDSTAAPASVEAGAAANTDAPWRRP